jgi:cytochrome c
VLFSNALARLVFTGLAALALSAGASPSHAEGGVGQGEDVFKQSCRACHTVAQGDRDKAGPNLFGVFGATAGQRAFSFKRHSPTLKQSGVVWNDETLDQFLENPKAFIPGNRMPFLGLAKKRDRENVIAYLKSVTQ